PAQRKWGRLRRGPPRPPPTKRSRWALIASLAAARCQVPPVVGRRTARDPGDAVAVEEMHVRMNQPHPRHLEPETQKVAPAILLVPVGELGSGVQDRVVVQ